MKFNNQRIIATVACLSAVMLATDLQGSSLDTLKTEVSTIQEFFSGIFFKAGMCLGTVVGILKSIHHGSIGMGLTTAGIGIGGYSLLSWIMGHA